MHQPTLRRLLLAVLCLAGCSSDGPGTSVEGTIVGKTFSPTTVLFDDASFQATVYLATGPLACGESPEHVDLLEVSFGNPAYEHLIEEDFQLTTALQTTAPWSIATFGRWTTGGQNTLWMTATAGVWRLEGVDSRGYRGSFELTFETGDRITGTYDARTDLCP